MTDEPNHVPCTECGRSTIDVERAVHAACRPLPPGVGPPVEVPRRRVVASQPAEERKPEVITPGHVVEPEEIPRGPKMVHNAILDAGDWEWEWQHSEAELLEGPYRGGESYGVKFRHPDGRHGWALWLRGSFVSAFVYPFPGAMVPEQFSSTDLRDFFRG